MLQLTTHDAALVVTVRVYLQEKTFPKTASVMNSALPLVIAVMIFHRPVVVVGIDVLKFNIIN